MANQKNYWKSTAELENNNAFVEDLKGREFVEKLPEEAFLGDDQAMNDSKTNRRDFLKYVGFSTAAASLAACEVLFISPFPMSCNLKKFAQGFQIFMQPPFRTALIMQVFS